jgi:hypothetical protein
MFKRECYGCGKMVQRDSMRTCVKPAWGNKRVYMCCKCQRNSGALNRLNRKPKGYF